MSEFAQSDIGNGNHLANKCFLHKALYGLCNLSPAEVKARLAALYAENAEWRGSHPLNEMTGVDAIHEQVWQPLMRSFPNLERRDLIIAGGNYKGHDMVACMGHYLGTFERDWLTIPATGHPVFIRYGEVHVVKDGRIIQSSCLWDIMDVMRQAGFWPIAPSTGIECMWPGPLTGDGLLLDETDADEGAGSLQQTLAMHKTLGDYNDLDHLTRESLISMPQREHWHPKMMWYGPSGIGTNRGLEGFVDFHQLPFRQAFPNRKGGAQLEGNKVGGHYVRIGDGKYSVTGGWPSVIANHEGPNFMGVGATNKQIGMRVMDFYLHHEGLIRENWVPIDTIDILMQMGVDVFERMQSMFKRGF